MIKTSHWDLKTGFTASDNTLTSQHVVGLLRNNTCCIFF